MLSVFQPALPLSKPPLRIIAVRSTVVRKNGVNGDELATGATVDGAAVALALAAGNSVAGTATATTSGTSRPR